MASFNKCYSNITKHLTEENILQANKVYENNLITHLNTYQDKPRWYTVNI